METTAARTLAAATTARAPTEVQGETTHDLVVNLAANRANRSVITTDVFSLEYYVARIFTVRAFVVISASLGLLAQYCTSH